MNIFAMRVRREIVVDMRDDRRGELDDRTPLAATCDQRPRWGR
jgi:hypothetical protein